MSTEYRTQADGHPVHIVMSLGWHHKHDTDVTCRLLTYCLYSEGNLASATRGSGNTVSQLRWAAKLWMQMQSDRKDLNRFSIHESIRLVMILANHRFTIHLKIGILNLFSILWIVPALILPSQTASQTASARRSKHLSFRNSGCPPPGWHVRSSSSR